MPKRSAGLLLYRTTRATLEVFLVHPGGPFWAKKDLGAWSIPKGEYGETEEPLEAAKREFLEETGATPTGIFHPLGQIKQGGGKLVTAWALEQDLDADAIRSNTFELEWPPGSGNRREFPEVDRGAWFPITLAREKILEAQQIFLARLVVMV